MGDFLSGYPWAHWCTLTFRPPATEAGVGCEPREWGRFRKRIRSDVDVSPQYALRQWRTFKRDTTTHANVPLFWFYGVEFGDRFGRMHLHALLGNTERLPTTVLNQAWPAGYSRILEYDANRGASYYITKYVAKDLAEWDISENLEAARRMYRARAAHLFRLGPSEPDALSAAALARRQKLARTQA